jgi:hypothetical protein
MATRYSPFANCKDQLLKPEEKFWKYKKKVYLFELARCNIAAESPNCMQSRLYFAILPREIRIKFKNGCNIKTFAICDTCAEKGLTNHTFSAQPQLVRQFL